MAVLRNVTGLRSKEEYVKAILASLPSTYQTEDKGTLLYTLYKVLSEELVQTDRQLHAVKNNIYIRQEIIDEEVKRSSETGDILGEENAFNLKSIRFVPSTFKRIDNFSLMPETSEVTLSYVPLSLQDIIIYRRYDDIKESVTVPLSFDGTTNILTFSPIKEQGNYSFEYTDTGDVTTYDERIALPLDLFAVGYDTYPYDFYGYDQ